MSVLYACDVVRFFWTNKCHGLRCQSLGWATGGHATWMQRRGGKQWRKRKERNEERKKAKKIKLRIATLNVETMTSKGREVVDLMERRGVDILCVQETHWKGERARCIGGGYKMWYCGSGNKKNGVGIILNWSMWTG